MSKNNGKAGPVPRATLPSKAGDPPKNATLCIDIGGTGIKAIVVDGQGKQLGEHIKIKTPRPAKPRPVLDIIGELAKSSSGFHRISVGFPGVVRNGVVETAPNLHPSWKGVKLSHTLQSAFAVPVRVANDADVQGYGAIAGNGVELVITLGTGLGSALFVNGALVPNLEAGHHPFYNGKTYEDCLGIAALKKIGRKRWNNRVKRAVGQLERMFNYDLLLIGGGNSAKIDPEQLPSNVKIVSNVAGLLGGVALWKE